MNPQQLLAAILDSLRSHLHWSSAAEWAGLGAAAVVTLLGLLFLLRGARWARGLAGLTFLVIGCGVGAAAAPRIGVSALPAIGIAGVGALLIALLFFRFVQAALLGVTFAALATGIYAARDLKPAIDSWLDPVVAEITLPPAGTVVGDTARTAVDEMGSLWQHLSANVPHFQLTFGSLVAIAGIVGLVLGWLLPRAARAFWASTFGTLFLGMGTAAILTETAPKTLDFLIANPGPSAAGVGTVWLAGLLYNLFRVRKRPRKVDADDTELAARPGPAAAARG